MLGEAAPLIGRQWPSLDLRAGALPCRLAGGEPEYLLLRRHGHAGWAIPKGHLMAFRGIGEAAQLEAWQEAGVHGVVGYQSIGSYIHLKASMLQGRRSEAVEVIVFPLEVVSVESQWPEMDIRERRWARAAEAPTLVASEKLRDIIMEFAPTAIPAVA
jgi:8-oxo-dGTP pyrophosphatase MutT (NUDIX family)